MKYELFQKIPEIEDISNAETMQKDKCFLYGENMINQKYEKQRGETITYYQVVSSLDDKNFLYIPKTDKLE